MEPTNNNLAQPEDIEQQPNKEVKPEETEPKVEKPAAPAPGEKAPTPPAQAPVTPPPTNIPTPPPATTPAQPQAPAPAPTNVPDETVDKQYIDKAEEIIETEANDPHKEEEDEEDLSQDYLKNKFNLDVGDTKEQ